MNTSYHNHTRWSDGAATMRGMIDAAAAVGLQEVGISDHYTLLADGEQMAWSMKPDAIDFYLDELRACRSEAPITVRLGLEADFVPETVERVREVVSTRDFDYVIGSVHFVDGFPIDEHRTRWDQLDQDGINSRWEQYWVRIRQMAESRVFDLAGHLDLPKKFGHRPTIDTAPAAESALDAIADSGMAMEINTSGRYLPAGEEYPSLSILRSARRRGIPICINADAHKADNIARGFLEARERAIEAGYTSVVRFAGRVRTEAPL